MDELIRKIANAVWSTGFSAKETNAIKKILSRTDCSEHEKATDICDIIGIQRRGNRTAIEIAIYEHNKTEKP